MATPSMPPTSPKALRVPLESFSGSLSFCGSSSFRGPLSFGRTIFGCPFCRFASASSSFCCSAFNCHTPNWGNVFESVIDPSLV
ncbi:hypothetical protein BC938DRAFT_478976 [Jimgerdemannia flammicorona]|uniref:Uncharacterized protein n=1 Tax=Jimgerdemannia flammicorona TaxID=994334 RepID=A0A433QLU9_9FUNG|nr:hypothetical protein BC938DRAFT_478976 [Jimgerdemannia flammicorona]